MVTAPISWAQNEVVEVAIDRPNRRMRNRSTGYAATQLGVQWQPEPIADNRNMERGQSFGQCLRRRALDELTNLKIFEKRSTYDLIFHRPGTHNLTGIANIWSRSDETMAQIG